MKRNVRGLTREWSHRRRRCQRPVYDKNPALGMSIVWSLPVASYSVGRGSGLPKVRIVLLERLLLWQVPTRYIDC